MRTLSLFSGYGGLDLAVEHVLGAETAYVADIDKGACKILAHRFPHAENLGDVSKVDYRSLGDIDVITGGFPCQDVSTAGKRAGMKDGTRSGLWSEMHRAVDELRPRYVVIENVRGLLSAEGEPPTGDMVALGEQARHLRNSADLVERKLQRAINEGNERYVAFHQRDAVRLIRARDRAVATERRERRTLVRAIGAVVGDLADIGYDAAWRGLRAADVGAPHGRFRVFILAAPADARGEHGGERRQSAPRQTPGGRPFSESPGRNRAPVALLGTPRTSSANGASRHRMAPGQDRGQLEQQIANLALLPTPRATDGTNGGPNQRGSSGDLMLPSAVVQLLPTPTTTQRGTDANLDTREGARANLHNAIADAAQAWGDYAPAIAQWERLTRPAPAPTEPTGKGGAHRLSPRFVEWMQGLPDGWITDVPGITRNEALKACGNGVVPQQAAAALEWLLNVSTGQFDLLAMEGQ